MIKKCPHCGIELNAIKTSDGQIMIYELTGPKTQESLDENHVRNTYPCFKASILVCSGCLYSEIEAV